MPITDDTAAGIEFDRLCPSTVCPELTVDEMLTILDRHKRATLWEASKVYELGSVVIPTLANRNGCRYRLVRYTGTASDQLSGATEPSWSTSRDASVTDNHVVWEEAGPDYGGVLWDFIGAARDGWLLKSSKASPSSDFETDAMAVKSSQLYDHCVAMSEKFQPVSCL